MDGLLLSALVLLALFSVLGAFDASWFHFKKYRLHAHPDTWREHLWHTGRAVLYPLWVGLLFVGPASGPVLWAGLAVAAVDFAIGLFDVVEETTSRRRFGGLPATEYSLHVVLVTLHTAALSLLLASRPAAAWTGTTTETAPTLQTLVVWPLVLFGVVGAIQHVTLALRHRPPTLLRGGIPGRKG